jgi:hypothetical protein
MVSFTGWLWCASWPPWESEAWRRACRCNWVRTCRAERAPALCIDCIVVVGRQWLDVAVFWSSLEMRSKLLGPCAEVDFTFEAVDIKNNTERSFDSSTLATV